MPSVTAESMQTSNQRQYQRYTFEVEVSASSNHVFFTGFTENISAGGLFLQTYQTMPLGSTFEIQLTIPGEQEPFQLQCEVRWLREYNELWPHMQTGMGIRFIGLTPEQERSLNACLAHMHTLFYED